MRDTLVYLTFIDHLKLNILLQAKINEQFDTVNKLGRIESYLLNSISSSAGCI